MKRALFSVLPLAMGISFSAHAVDKTTLVRCTPQSHDFEYAEVVLEKTPMRTPMYFTELVVYGVDDSVKSYGGAVSSQVDLDHLTQYSGQLSFVGISKDTTLESPEKMTGAAMVRIANLGDGSEATYQMQLALGGAIYTLSCE